MYVLDLFSNLLWAWNGFLILRHFTPIAIVRQVHFFLVVCWYSQSPVLAEWDFYEKVVVFLPVTNAQFWGSVGAKMPHLDSNPTK